MTVEESLENGLDEAYSWVDAAARDSGGDLDGSVQGKTYGEAVHWHVLGSVLLHNLEHENDEEGSHDGLNEEYLPDHLASIVAAESWAQLSDIVGSGHWERLIILREENHGSSAEDASECGSNKLEEHHNLTVDNTERNVVMSVLNHHTNCYSRIKVSATDSTEHLGHHCDREADANGCVR